jgi:sarcosine/dimethylglycine N-methyltransferase
MKGFGSHYSVSDIESRILAALREAGLDLEQRLSPVDLGALDHFHTGGFPASLILQELAQISPSDRVLDLGAGLAGPARMLAASPGCRVDCIDLSPDYCAGAALLNRLTGLDHLIDVHEGSALELPFADDTFDVVWMQNVGMNIEDKQKFYAEIHRVLKPNGRFAFQEMTAGDSETSYFPLPWANEACDNFLMTAEDMDSVLGETGFIAEYFEDVSDSQLNPSSSSSSAPTTQVQLSLSVYVDNLATKGGNATRSLQEGQIRFHRGVFRTK